VIMLRDLEAVSTAEAAEVLDISEENVKTRLYRAREALREQIYNLLGPEAQSAFTFAGLRCDRVVNAVFARIKSGERPPM
jgi:RNA polymerase sigma-70 factor, ECF subfamily